MPGAQITLFPRRSFDFSNVIPGESVATQIIKAMDVSQYTEATLIVRVHSRTDIRDAAEFKVLLATTSPTPEDPTSDFIHPTPVAAATINSTTVIPSLVVEQLTPGFGAQLTVFVEATQDAAGAKPIEVELSAELVLKA